MPRIDGRRPDELRPIRIERDYLDFAEGSCLISTGKTKILCSASVEDGVPEFLNGSGRGWVTAEYAMLPKSTKSRSPRDSNRGGRAREIQRLIGRSLRAVIDFKALGERTIILDCDVIQADGGTRTASITGAMIALHDAVSWMRKAELISSYPIRDLVAATSVGIVNGECLLDLCYAEDSAADVDFNVVMAGTGEFIELQGTAEERPFNRECLDRMLALAGQGIEQLCQIQRETLEL